MEKTQSAPVRALKRKGIIQLVIGGILTLLFGMSFIGQLSADQETVNNGAFMLALALMICGICLLVSGYRKFRLIRLFPTYSATLAADPHRSILTLAASCGTDVNKVFKRLQQMIRHRLFVNAHIDPMRQCLIFGNEQQQAAIQAARAAEAALLKTVDCPSCGAVNTVRIGTVGTCDFCGSPVQYDA